jgi:HD-like signal output (HDOD) protein
MGSKPRILLLDENVTSLAQLRQEFSPLAAHWDIDYSDSAIEGVTRILDGPHYEVVVIDIGIESEDPVKILSAIAERFPNTIRFALTDKTDDRRITRASSLAHQFVYRPCDFQTLRMQINRAIALREKLRACPLRHKLHEVSALPPLPSIYQELMREIHSRDPSVANIAQIMSRDVAMSAKVLQIVNSAAVGLRNEITNVSQAASLLGLQRISSMVLTVEVFNLVAPGDLPDCVSLQFLWDHSLKVAEFAKRICQCETQDVRSIEAAFTSGLLHDLGMLLVASKFPDELNRAFALARSQKISLHSAELEVMGAAHAEVGGYLLDLWGLPDAIVEAITFHDMPSHVPEREYETNTGNLEFSPLLPVHVANYLCGEAVTEHYGCPEAGLDTQYLHDRGFVDRLAFWWQQCTEDSFIGG